MSISLTIKMCQTKSSSTDLDIDIIKSIDNQIDVLENLGF